MSQKTIERIRNFDSKYPFEQAEMEKESIKTVSESTPSDKVTEKEKWDAFSRANQEGHANKKEYTYVLPTYDGKVKTMVPKDTGVKIDYETINEEKRRVVSGYRPVLTKQEYETMPETEKAKVAGAKEPFDLYPGMFSEGNVLLNGPRSGRSHKVASNIYAGEYSQ